MASAQQSREEVKRTPATDNASWMSVLQLVFGKEINQDMDIKIGDEAITITGPSASVDGMAANYRTLMTTPGEEFQRRLPLVPESLDRKVAEVKRLEPQPAMMNHAQCLQIAKQLFGETIPLGPSGARLNLDEIFDVTKGAGCHQGVLSSIPLNLGEDVSSAEERKLWIDAYKKAAKKLAWRFQGVGSNRIREAWAQEGKSLPEKKGSEKQDEIPFDVYQVFPSIVLVVSDEDPKKMRLDLDLQHLYECYFDPVLETKADAAVADVQPKKTISFSKKHLAQRLKQLMGDEVFIRLNPEGTLEGVFISNTAKKVQKPYYIFDLCDNSGSMKNEEEDRLKDAQDDTVGGYKLLVKSKNMKGSKYVSVFFNGQAVEREFDLDEKSQPEFEAWVRDKKAFGQTRLSGTIREQVAGIVDDELGETWNVVFIVRTDGKDNNLDNNEQKLSPTIDENLAAIDASMDKDRKAERNNPCYNRIQIFALPYGKKPEDVNMDFLQKLAEKSGGQCKLISNREEFESVLQSLFSDPAFLFDRTAVEFLFDNKQDEVMTKTFYHSGTPQTVQLHTLDGKPPRSITINGRLFTVSQPAPAAVFAGPGAGPGSVAAAAVTAGTEIVVEPPVLPVAVPIVEPITSPITATAALLVNEHIVAPQENVLAPATVFAGPGAGPAPVGVTTPVVQSAAPQASVQPQEQKAITPAQIPQVFNGVLAQAASDPAMLAALNTYLENHGLSVQLSPSVVSPAAAGTASPALSLVNSDARTRSQSGLPRSQIPMAVT